MIAQGPQCGTPFSLRVPGTLQPSPARNGIPVTWLPHGSSGTLQSFLLAAHATREVPETLLSPIQRRVRNVTLRTAVFDAEGARQTRHHILPAYFLDFETIQFGVPRWVAHTTISDAALSVQLASADASGELTHSSFLDLLATTRRKPCCCASTDCSEPLPVFVYHAGSRVYG